MSKPGKSAKRGKTAETDTDVTAAVPKPEEAPKPRVVGLRPWLPWPLDRSPWWTEPVRAERLAALRIGVAVVLLFDVLCIYLPYARDFFGAASLGAPEVFTERRSLPHWPWSILSSIEAPLAWYVILIVWALAAVCLGLGVYPRIAAAAAWFIGGSVDYVNPYIFNSGDAVRNLLLFYLIISPTGAVWSVMNRRRSGEPVYVQAWPLRLIYIQMCLIYCVSGLSKLNADWLSDSAIYRVMSNVAWGRWSYNDFGLPYPITFVLSWITVLWEITFPLFITWQRTRKLTMVLGLLFHLGTGASMRIVLFGCNMLCFYLPLLPWERWLERAAEKRAEPLVGQ
jgi:hypothetical protein